MEYLFDDYYQQKMTPNIKVRMNMSSIIKNVKMKKEW
jgi:hypothetical protein